MKKFVGSFLMIVVAAITAPAHAEFRPAGDKSIKDRYIVVLKKDVLPGEVRGLAIRLAQRFGGTAFAPMTDGIRGFAVLMKEQQARALSKHPLVELVEQDEWLTVSNTPPAFDFRTRAAKQKATNTLRSSTNAVTSCPWTGSYYECSYANDEFWALDRLDQLGKLLSQPRAYGYSTAGSGVLAYVIGFGVHEAHTEFSDGAGNRVEDGFNMMMDPEILWGPEQNPPLPGYPGEENSVSELDNTPATNPCGTWPGQNNVTAHDTAAASVLGGNTTGVAKNVTIVPVKTIRCYYDDIRRDDYDYQSSKLALARGLSKAYEDVMDRRNTPPYEAVPAVAMISPSFASSTPGSCECGPNPGPGCTYDPHTQKYWTNCLSAIEHQINELASIRVASVVPARNFDDDACTASPGRMGYGGSYPTTYRTITVGGTMYTSSFAGNTEDARWTCAAQPGGCDSFGPENPGSSYGSCVSIWAPAWNVKIAGGGGPNSYRSPYGASSGTSWAAPYVAGVVARLLETNPYWTVGDVWNRLVSDANQRLNVTSMPDFDPSSTFNNKLVYMGPTE